MSLSFHCMNRETEGRDTCFANDVDGFGAFTARVQGTRARFSSIQTFFAILKNNELNNLSNQS